MEWDLKIIEIASAYLISYYHDRLSKVRNAKICGSRNCDIASLTISFEIDYKIVSSKEKKKQIWLRPMT